MSREVTFSLECRGEAQIIQVDPGKYQLRCSHLAGEFVLGPSHPKSYTRWHRRPKRITLAVQTSLYQAQTCVHTHTHRRVHTKRLPPQTPTDTQPHPSISMRMAGREPRVGGDARGLTVTQPHAMKHSPDHHHPTLRSTWNPQTHAHSDTAHTRTPPAPAPNTGTGLSTHMQ